jgi:hypothetical protein
MGVAVLHQPGKSVRTFIVLDSGKRCAAAYDKSEAGIPPPPQNHRTGSNRIFPVEGEMECIHMTRFCFAYIGKDIFDSSVFFFLFF